MPLGDPPVAHVLEVATSSAPQLERARRLVEGLHSWLPVDAVWLTLSDPDSNVYATVGAPRPEPGPGDRLAVPLTEPDGRHQGMLHLRFASAEAPSQEVRDDLGRLLPLIAQAVSPTRSLLASAMLVQRASSGLVLLRDGSTYGLPGMGDDAVLIWLPRAVDVARRGLLDGQVYRSFMWPTGDEVARPHVRVTAIAATDAPAFVLGAVLLTDEVECNNLTARELEVLGLMVDGRSNQQIAQHLVIAARTVATHVEHILHKLEVPTRTHAAVRAEREGCYVPAPPVT